MKKTTGIIEKKIDKFNYINKSAWKKNTIDIWQTEEKYFIFFCIVLFKFSYNFCNIKNFHKLVRKKINPIEQCVKVMNRQFPERSKLHLKIEHHWVFFLFPCLLMSQFIEISRGGNWEGANYIWQSCLGNA